jgi:hypothetical protein
VWQYSDSASDYNTNVVTDTQKTVSDEWSLLLSSDVRLRFLPKSDFVGKTSFTYKLWHGVEMNSGEYADTTSSPSAFGNKTMDGSIAVLPVNDRPVVNTASLIITSPYASFEEAAYATTLSLSGVSLDDFTNGTLSQQYMRELSMLLNGNITVQTTTAYPTRLEISILVHSYKTEDMLPMTVSEITSIFTSHAYAVVVKLLSFETFVVGPSVLFSGSNVQCLLGLSSSTVKPNNGETVSSMLDRTDAIDVDPSDVLGFAVVDVPSCTLGQWQYRHGTSAWANFEAGSIDRSAALILHPTASIR